MKIFIAIALVMFSTLSIASPIPDFPFVTVQGESSKKVKPDLATFEFSVSAFSETSKDARNNMHNATAKVIELIMKLGVSETAITSFDIDKQTKRRRDVSFNQLDILGYEFNRRISVELSDLEVYPMLIDGLSKMEFISNFSAKFDTSQRDAISTELISVAASNAKKQATLMAQGLGVEIDSVYAFNDTGSFASFFATFGLERQSENAWSRGFVDSYKAQSYGNGKEDLTFIPTYIEVSKKVNVIYKLK